MCLAPFWSHSFDKNADDAQHLALEERTNVFNALAEEACFVGMLDRVCGLENSV